MTADLAEPLDLAQTLMRAPSVTPADLGALDALQRARVSLGCAWIRLPCGEVEHRDARLGTAGPNLCYAGHTDVVPPV